MVRINRILAPVHLSTRSPGMAQYAHPLFEKFGSKVEFIHALRLGSALEPAEAEILSTIAASDRKAPATSPNGASQDDLLRTSAPRLLPGSERVSLAYG